MYYRTEVLEPGTLVGKKQLIYCNAAPITPLVSCIMVTRGNPLFVEAAVDSFRNQTYKNIELIIVADSNKVFSGLTERYGLEKDITIVFITRERTLGELRNIGLSSSSGDIFCQWDDDDLYHRDRIKVGVSSLLQTNSAAVFLRRWIVWWPKRKIIAISYQRTWEGSIIAWKALVPSYPRQRRGEDSVMVNQLWESQRVCLLDSASLYCYVIHGNNTWPEKHFEGVIGKDSRIFAEKEYQTMFTNMKQFFGPSRFVQFE